MRAEDLRLEELVSFADGSLSLRGRRLVLHDLHAFAQFRHDLVAMVGRDQARRILTRFGHFWGQADCAAMQRIFTWDSVSELLRAGPRIHTLQGVARTRIRTLEVDPATPALRMAVAWHDSGEAEEHLIEFGETDHPVCWMLAGYASGYASYALGTPVYFIETDCRAAGAAVCLAEGRDLAGWGDRIEPYLPYFQADDIRGKVERLSRELRRRDAQLARQRRRLRELGDRPIGDLVEIHSPAYRRVVETAAAVARFDTSVLLTGDSGTGKDVLAREIHRLSPRAGGPFVVANCAALPETLMEGELFGYRAGAFTGADRDRAGLCEQADGGTLLLDEVGDIPPGAQVKLLRVLQEREVVRLGENTPRAVNIRVLAATNVDLAAAVAAGRFREDLYYRLAVVPIELPPLRERREDILPLARHFVRRFADHHGLPDLRLDARCLDLLQSYAWPGNVRELRNAIEYAAVFSREGLIEADVLPRTVVEGAGMLADPAGQTLAEVERRHIERVLRQTDGNRAAAARLLGISPTTLWRRLRDR